MTSPAEPDAGLSRRAAAILDAEDVDDTAAVPTGFSEAEEQRAGVLMAGGGTMALREIIRHGGVRTLAVLFVLNLADEFDRAAFGILGPDIQRSLDLTDLTLALASTLAGFMVVVAAVPIGALGDRRSRTRLVAVCSGLWAIFGLLTGFVQNAWQLIGARMLSGLGKANEGPLQKPILADAYPIAGRGRVFAIHNLANPVGSVLGTIGTGLVVVAISGPDAWRWAFMLMAIPAGIAALVAFGVPEPGRGRHEQVEVLGEELSEDPDDTPAASLSASFARLRRIRTFHFGLAGLAATGFGVFTVPIFVNLILDRNYGLDAAGRGLVGAITAVGGLVGAAIGGWLSDRLAQDSPAKVMHLTGAAVASLAITLPVSVAVPNAALYTVIGFFSSMFLGAAIVPATTVFAAAIPYRLRSTGFALVGIHMAVVGGVGGAIISGLLSSAHGPRVAIWILVPPTALLGGALFAYGGRSVAGDMAMVAADIAEEAAERRRVGAGGEIPILQVRNLDVSYGPVQVLFEVDLDVREGEILALLGTNGAGKSTLLQAISGLRATDRGVVRFRGRDITLTDPVTRVELGIVQVLGGKAVFGDLTVRDNLAAAAFTLRDGVDAAIEQAIAPFPVLRERLDQPAGSLSGGEQQMLGLAKAMILHPELLIIDELSLGLAPVVVQELLGIVEGLRDAGTTVVIVEQSVNVALAIADRAVFMEKGQVRFEGPAHDLLERDDLLRAVFLGRGDR